MRWLKFIFDQYIDDTAEPITLEENKKNKKVSISVGDVYVIGSLYYIIADIDEYPYEVYITSPYWELASHKDLIVDGRERRWVMLSVPRYATDNVIAQSIRLDRIPETYVDKMAKHLNDGDVLPQDMTGLSYREGDNSYQELFRKREIERSRALFPIS